MSGYVVVDEHDQVSKHYYIGSERIASRLGGIVTNYTTGMLGSAGDVDLLEKRQVVDMDEYSEATGIRMVYSGAVPVRLELPCNKAHEVNAELGKQCDCYKDNICPEVLYYYHPDQVGSSTALTDANGLPYQFILYLPYGEVMAEEHVAANPADAPWAAHYLFNGKEQDASTGMYYYGARYYDARISVWHGVDPLAEEFPSWSAYSFSFNNSLRFIDPDGRMAVDAVPPDDYVFNQHGDFMRVVKNNKPDRLIIENSKTGAVQGIYDFNDPVNDVADINSGKINKVFFVSEAQINQQMIDNGSTTTTENRWKYIERESRPVGDKSLLSGISSGKLDLVASSPLVKGSNTLHLVNGNGSTKTGVGYNNFDFGNFLWGQSGKKLGFSIGTLQVAAHINNALYGRFDNPSLNTGIFDSPGDQRAIRAGYFYPKGEPVF